MFLIYGLPWRLRQGRISLAGGGGWGLLCRSVLCRLQMHSEGTQSHRYMNPFSERPGKKVANMLSLPLTRTQQTGSQGPGERSHFPPPRGEETGRSGRMETFEHVTPRRSSPPHASLLPKAERQHFRTPSRISPVVTSHSSQEAVPLGDFKP